ncbi:putative ankyrin repeat protein RF_0381 isoform X8 [Dermacentor albipictus]|uniref:putative ankyrin repeat protein RF_0381 isoform X8 n=1 Tax=Dermacentor albipictus TaxID=60249 RepID=UPI0031FCC697
MQVTFMYPMPYDITESALFDAVTTGDELSVRRLLDDNAPFTITNNDGENYLHLLAKQNFSTLSPQDSALRQKRRRNIIYMLSDEGLRPDLRDSMGRTPMHYAIQNSDPHLFKILLQCSPNPPDDICAAAMPTLLQDVLNKFKPGLCAAIQQHCITDVRRIVNMWCRTDALTNGCNLKELALESGHEEIISLILGVEPSMRLVHHVLARKVEKVRNLLGTERGNLNLDLRNMSDHGAPILYYAIANKDTDIVRLLVSAGCHIFTLMRDADNQEIPVLFSALTTDMSPKLANALMPKDLPSQREVIRRLLYKSRTILEVALEKRIPPVTLEILIYRGGAELLAGRNPDNKTVRDIAQHAEQYEYVEAVDKESLMQLAPDTVKYLEGITDYQKQIAELSRAVEDGNFERFEELRTYSSAVFRTNISWEACQKANGQPLLHRAVLFNRPHIVKTILHNVPAGQSVDTLLDQHHRTALHYAYAMPDGDHLIKLLMNAGCSEHTLDRKGMEPLDFKMRCGSPAMEALLKHIRCKVPLEESRIWNSKNHHKKDLPKCCQGVECKLPLLPPKQIHATGCSCQVGHVPNKNAMQGQIDHRDTSWCTIL